MSLEDQINKVRSGKRPALWKGPSGEGPLGGVTYSLMCRFLNDRERFRLYAIEGLRPPASFNHKIEYGNMWHVCEEWAARDKSKIDVKLKEYVQELAKKYKYQQKQVAHWYEVCKRQFPVYLDFWQKHPRLSGDPILSESVFDVPYKLPSGRTVRLRGKWDSVDVLNKQIWLQENKTKGDVDQLQLENQLTFDLQTMIYLVALNAAGSSKLSEKGWSNQTVQTGIHDVTLPGPIVGVRYNVVRRPLSGGKGTIRQHQPSKSNPAGESKESFYNRLAEYFKEDPAHYFMRWEVKVSQEDIIRFRKRTLDPILEQMCDWYEWVTDPEIVDPFECGRSVSNELPAGGAIHWQHPYGVRNMIDEGVTTEYDNYLATGIEVGLTRATTLFEELQS